MHHAGALAHDAQHAARDRRVDGNADGAGRCVLVRSGRGSAGRAAVRALAARRARRQRRLRVLEVGARGAVGLLRRVEIARRRDAALAEAALALELAAREIELGLGRAHGRLRLRLAARVEQRGVDRLDLRHHRLAGDHGIADLHLDAPRAARHRRREHEDVAHARLAFFVDRHA